MRRSCARRDRRRACESPGGQPFGGLLAAFSISRVVIWISFCSSESSKSSAIVPSPRSPLLRFAYRSFEW